MKLFFISVFVSMFTFVYASMVVGNVEQLKGNVKIKSEDSFKKSIVVAGLEIKEGDLLTTSDNASAMIKLIDGSSIVLDENSTVHFKSVEDAEQKSGKVLYKITSRDAKNSLKVKTPFAIIGIKGTTFVIDASENGSVLLKEGLIGVASIKEEFNLYRKKVEEEFNKFKDEQMSEFELFKAEQNKYAEPVQTKEFDLKEGNRISFSDNDVKEDAFSENDEAEFAHFDELINSMK